MKALLFGSIGVIAETSELQRQAYNMAFAEHGLDWYWNVANYCRLLNDPGGVKRLTLYARGSVAPDLIQSIHQAKEVFFETLMMKGIAPRQGVVSCLENCAKQNIKVGFITTTSQRNIDNLAKALSRHIDFGQFDLITTKQDVVKEKPDGEVYRLAVTKLGVNREDVIAIEDTEANQEAALQEQILCYLFAGEYATTRHNINAVKSLNIIGNQIL